MTLSPTTTRRPGPLEWTAPWRGAAFLLLGAATAAHAGSLGLAIGIERDRPAVRDGQSFASGGSFQPLGSLSWSGRLLGPAGFRFEAGLARRSFSSVAFAAPAQIRVDVFQAALLGSGAIRLGGSTELQPLFGPQVDFRLRALREFRGSDQDVTEELHEADAALVAGLRVARRIGRVALAIDARLAWGLTDLDNTGQQSIHSRAVSLRLGIER